MPANYLAGLSAIMDQFAMADAHQKEKDAYLLNMGELRRSAQLSEADATATMQRGTAEAGKQRMAGTNLEGQQKLAYAMGGIDASSGTAEQTQRSSAVFNELDAQTLHNNAVREAFGHQESARKYAAAAKRIDDYVNAPNQAGFSPFDAEYLAKSSASALSSAASFGMGAAG